MLNDQTARRTVLELTEVQRAQVFEESGVVMRQIHGTGPSFVGMILAAESRGLRGSAGPDSRILLRLSEAQQRQMQEELGTSGEALLFALEGDVGFHESWTDEFPVVELTERLRVVPHSAGRSARDGEVVVRMIAEAAERGVFGTGRHPTTRLVARLVEKWIQPGGKVVDVGTGSGLLAIAAALLGAEHVLAVEIDEAAAARASENVALNGLVGQVVVECRELQAETDGPVELVIANLFPGILLRLAPALATVVAPGGTLILSGVVERRIDDVVSALKGRGFEVVDQQSEGVWSACALRKIPGR